MSLVSDDDLIVRSFNPLDVSSHIVFLSPKADTDDMHVLCQRTLTHRRGNEKLGLFGERERRAVMSSTPAHYVSSLHFRLVGKSNRTATKYKPGR